MLDKVKAIFCEFDSKVQIDVDASMEINVFVDAHSANHKNCVDDWYEIFTDAAWFVNKYGVGVTLTLHLDGGD